MTLVWTFAPTSSGFAVAFSNRCVLRWSWEKAAFGPRYLSAWHFSLLKGAMGEARPRSQTGDFPAELLASFLTQQGLVDPLEATVLASELGDSFDQLIKLYHELETPSPTMLKVRKREGIKRERCRELSTSS